MDYSHKKRRGGLGRFGTTGNVGEKRTAGRMTTQDAVNFSFQYSWSCVPLTFGNICLNSFVVFAVFTGYHGCLQKTHKGASLNAGAEQVWEIILFPRS